MHDLTGFQGDILYVVSGVDGPDGLDINENFEDYYELEIHHGRPYPNLDTRLEKGQNDGLRNIHSLTQRGMREIEERLDWGEQYIE